MDDRRFAGRVRAARDVVVVTAVAAVVVVLGLVVGAGRTSAVAQPSPSPSQGPSVPAQLGTTEGDPSPSPAPAIGEGGTDPEPVPTDPPSTPADGATGEPTDGEPDPEATPSVEPTGDVDPAGDDAQIQPSVRRSKIPLGTILLAVGVLAAVGLGAFLTGGRSRSEDAPGRGEQAGARAATAPPPSPPERSAERELIAFLLELGRALIDAGDAVNEVGGTLRTIAEAEGLAGVGVVVLPTALIISLPGRENVQTQVTGAGAGQLRLDQTEALLRLVEEARDGRIGPAAGRARLARLRASDSPVRTPIALVGHGLAAVGLALILRGNVTEVALAGVFGAAIGALQELRLAGRSTFRPFLPLVASFLIAIGVFLFARVIPGLAILPPLVAPLIPFLPGGLLTIGMLELATGESVSGVARLGSGALQLLLLAGGIIGAAQLVGIPAAADVTSGTAATGLGGVGVLAPWLGVAVFGLGIAWARAAERTSVPWMLLVLVVAYAGQVVGGLLFGSALSAFFGALAMTPVAVYASRQEHGPPALVTFLPGFWLLVPGALGLEGVTRFLGDGGAQGLTTMVTTVTAMVGIALGILLGSLVAAPDTWRFLRRGGRSTG